VRSLTVTRYCLARNRSTAKASSDNVIVGMVDLRRPIVPEDTKPGNVAPRRRRSLQRLASDPQGPIFFAQPLRDLHQ
jgi:hypothetical protein